MNRFSSLLRQLIAFFRQLPLAYRAVLLVVSVSIVVLVFSAPDSSTADQEPLGVAAAEFSSDATSIRISLPLSLDSAVAENALEEANPESAASGDADSYLERAGASSGEMPMWSYVIQPGDTLTGIFERLRLPIRDLYQVLEADENVLALDNIKPGVKLQIDIEDEKLQRLELQFSLAHKVTYKRKQEAGFEFIETQLPGTWKQYGISGEIDRNFSLDAEAKGLDAKDAYLITRLLKEKINFRRDIRKGDAFEVLLSRQYVDDEPTGETKVEAVRLMANRSPVSIFYYDGSYYDEKGRSLSKAFLRYPFSGHYRVSSSFNPNRHHPVTGLFRPHNGTDFSMRSGTPLLAAGDGVVTRVVNHKYAGLYVEIKHSERYTTRYLHLSKSLVRKGQRVSRGQKIALSGASGRVTGPHLHYEFRIAGRPVDATKAPIPIAKRLEGKSRKEFDALLKQYLARLDAPKPKDGSEDMLISRLDDGAGEKAPAL